MKCPECGLEQPNHEANCPVAREEFEAENGPQNDNWLNWHLPDTTFKERPGKNNTR